jgi:hypothetical protein
MACAWVVSVDHLWITGFGRRQASRIACRCGPGTMGGCSRLPPKDKVQRLPPGHMIRILHIVSFKGNMTDG